MRKHGNEPALNRDGMGDERPSSARYQAELAQYFAEQGLRELAEGRLDEARGYLGRSARELS